MKQMRKVIRIGSRESRLAVIQSEIVKQLIESNHQEIQVEIVTMKTSGDRILDKALYEVGGKGLFVKELDTALRNKTVDIAVHSMKDLPMEIPDDLPVVACTKREDPRDVLIYRPGLSELPDAPVIGTSSRRRILQASQLYPGCICQNLRGNVQTRMQKLEDGEYDGIILAAAGIKRLGLDLPGRRILSTKEMLPAAGQGIMAVQGRAGEDYSWLLEVGNRESSLEVKAERSFVRALGGSCSSPIGAYAEVKGKQMKLTGLYYHEASGQSAVDSITGEAALGRELGITLAESLKRRF